MEFGWSDEDLKFRTELRRFVDEYVPPEWRALPKHRHPHSDADRRRVMEFTRALGERGWLTPHWPVEYGGSGATAWQHMILGEELWGVGEPRGPQYMNVNWIGPSILLFGTDRQKEEHLPPIARGEVFWAQGFSEPDAGSDLAALRTAAQLDGDVYVVNGHKIWTSHCYLAQWLYLLVRTDPAAERHRGISVLLVPLDTPGIEIREIAGVAGEGAFNEVIFTDARVPVANRLGPEHGGWGVVQETLKFERLGAPHWARQTNFLDRVAEWAISRGRFEDPEVRERLGGARAAVEASRLIAYSVVDERARGVEQSARVYLARAAMVRAARAVADAALEIQGAEAAIEESLAAEAMFEAMINGVAAGAYEIQLNLIAGQVLGMRR